MNKIIKDIKEALNTDNKTKAYDTQAKVIRSEGQTLWVHIPGGVDETPVKKTINAKAGDTVQVRVSGGSAWLVGNQSAPPTDDTRAIVAETTAITANENATIAAQAAESAVESANVASAAAASAQTSAGNALTAAQSAQTSADSALVSLSTVEDVVGVLNWITAHGTMTLTSDVAINPAHVYFVVDPTGDYVVGGTHYSIVAEPKVEDISTYYELSVDESVQNYVATHVVVDTEGLWLIPDSGGNKVLIATGAGSSFTTAGTYIIGKVSGVDTVFAKFTTDGATMNATNSTQIAHLGYGVGTAQSGTATAPYYTLGLRLNNSTVGNYSVAEGRNTTASGYCSHAEGGPSGSPNDGPVASGESSHAEGSGTLSSGKMAHAEGRYTEANGLASHAQNDGTIANGESQTVLGKYNVADTTSAVIIGNGTSSARSNALTVDWSGNVNIPAGANYCINNVPIGGGGGGDVTGVKGNAEVSYRTGNVNLTPANIGAVPTTRTVNGKALSSDITLSASDVSALPSSTVIPTITDTYNGTSSDGMSGKAVKSAIDALDGSVTGTAGSGKTLTAFSQTDGKVSATFGNISITKSQISDFPSLATVATSGDYNDLLNKPTIPTVNNATLTIQRNGTTVDTFTANASTNVTANISVPTTTSDLFNDSGFITSADIPKEYDFTSSLTPSIDARGVSRAQYAVFPTDTSSLTSANGLKISAYLDYNGTIFYPLSVVYVEISTSLGKFNIYVKSFRDSVQSTSSTYVSGTLHIVAPFQISSVSTYK